MAIHGMSGTPIYRVWADMTQRCTNPKNKRYNRYGDRGIKICEAWRNSSTFIEWGLANGYKEGLTIDRVDNDKGYSPENCRWVTRTIQARNTGHRKDNTSGYRGVSRNGKKKWMARIQVDGIRISLGTFDTPIEAAHAYDDYVIAHDLEHTLNFERTT